MANRSPLLLLPILLLLGATPPAIAKETVSQASCHQIDQEEVEALFHQWNKALLTKQPDAVVARYAPDATLLPTVKTGPLLGKDAIRGYFTTFLKQSPEAAIERRVIHSGCNIAYDIGLYDFMVDGDQPNTRKQVKARYTFIYEFVHGQWLIVHHHSSAQPVP